MKKFLFLLSCFAFAVFFSVISGCASTNPIQIVVDPSAEMEKTDMKNIEIITPKKETESEAKNESSDSQNNSESSVSQSNTETSDITLAPGEEKIPLEDLNLDILGDTYITSSQQSSLDQADDFVSPLIYSAGTHTDKELYKFFCAHSKENHPRAKKIAKLYIEECATEGINSDVAFVQMCHETNFLRFGNLVKKEWNNFCGLGAIDEKQPGLQFKTMQLGVRAHIQHLHAYATPEEIKLNNECIDPRYKYVRPRAKATTVEGLSGTWATDKFYAEKIIKYLKELK